MRSCVQSELSLALKYSLPARPSRATWYVPASGTTIVMLKEDSVVLKKTSPVDASTPTAGSSFGANGARATFDHGGGGGGGGASGGGSGGSGGSGDCGGIGGVGGEGGGDGGGGEGGGDVVVQEFIALSQVQSPLHQAAPAQPPESVMGHSAHVLARCPPHHTSVCGGEGGKGGCEGGTAGGGATGGGGGESQHFRNMPSALGQQSPVRFPQLVCIWQEDGLGTAGGGCDGGKEGGGGKGEGGGGEGGGFGDCGSCGGHGGGGSCGGNGGSGGNDLSSVLLSQKPTWHYRS